MFDQYAALLMSILTTITEFRTDRRRQVVPIEKSKGIKRRQRLALWFDAECQRVTTELSPLYHRSDFFGGEWLTPALLGCSVPQGNILWPVLFLLYAADATGQRHGLDSHSYADDTQVYDHFKSASCGPDKSCYTM